MKTYATYAGIYTIASALLNLALFFTGFQTEKLAIGQHLQWLDIIIFGIVLFLGMKEYRENLPNKAISYGKAVGVAAMIALFAGLFKGVYVYIHFSFVNPNFPDYVLDLVRKTLEAKNVPDAQIGTIIEFQRKMLHPVVQTISTVVFSPIMGSIFGLILAIFVKREAPKDEIKAA